MAGRKTNGARKLVTDEVADVLSFRAVEIYLQAQDTALAWFTTCEVGPNDFAGAKRKVDDLLLKHATMREAIELLGKLKS